MKFHPRVWLNGFLGVFKPLEKAVLDSLIERMPAGIQEILETQIREVTLVQRHESGRVANFYKIKRGVILEDFSVRLSDTPREQVLAKMLFKAHSGAELKAECWAANGHLFSIEFNIPPASDVRYSDITLLKFESFSQRVELEAKQLPSDYESLASSSEFVLKFDEIYDVGFESARYWVLAEVPDLGVLGVQQNSPDPVIYLLSYDGRNPTKLGISLARALTAAFERVTGRG